MRQCDHSTLKDFDYWWLLTVTELWAKNLGIFYKMLILTFDFLCSREFAEVDKIWSLTGHRGVCCNPCNWDSRYWMPTLVGDP